jgi:hypothetical protein
MIDDELLVVLGLLEDEVPVYAVARELEVPRQEVSRGTLREMPSLPRRRRATGSALQVDQGPGNRAEQMR